MLAVFIHPISASIAACFLCETMFVLVSRGRFRCEDLDNLHRPWSEWCFLGLISVRATCGC